MQIVAPQMGANHDFNWTGEGGFRDYLLAFIGTLCMRCSLYSVGVLSSPN